MTPAENRLKIAVVKESFPGERRVALVPLHLAELAKAGFEILIESGAGDPAGFPDESYHEKGARIAPNREELFSTADVVLFVRAFGANPVSGADDLKLSRKGQAVVGLMEPLASPESFKIASEKGLSAFALELLPRISRAQSMDVLSSMASIAGYKVVLLAAAMSPKMFPMMMTAAGTINPSRVLIVGAGVAGLQAIATAKRLGALITAYDIRPAVKEQVESLGAKFLELSLDAKSAEDKGGYARAMDDEFYRRQREMMTGAVAESDVVITTAAVPGRKAPILITKEMVEKMKPGSVLIDLAAERGGNCEVTKPGETVELNGVKIAGPLNLPSTVPYHSSQMYSRNISNFIKHIYKGGKLIENGEDEIFRETLVVKDGEIVHKTVKELLR